MYILSFQADSKVNALRKSGCPSYDKLRQLFASMLQLVPIKFHQTHQAQIVMKSVP